MTSTKSYNNLGKNMRDQLHKMRSFVMLLGVIYLAAGPAWMLLQMTSYTRYNNLTLLANYFIGYFTAFYYLALALGIAGGLYVTRYQNVPNQSNFYHSLPITRQGLLSARILSLLLIQVLYLIVVTMVDVVVVWVTVPSISNELAVNLTMAAGLHFCYIMLVFLLSLAVTLFAGQLTANTVGQVLMTAVFHVSVALFGAVMMAVVGSFSRTIGQVGFLEHLTRFNILAGFMGANLNVTTQLNALNPALVSSENAGNFAPSQLVWPLTTTVIYIVLIVALFAATYMLYQRRAVDKAGDTLLFPYVGSCIKVLYVFLGSVLCGIFFREMIAESIIGLVIGAILAAIVVHMIAEMIYSMDVDGVRRHYVSAIVGLVLALAVSLGFQSGFFSLDERLPEASSVKGAVMIFDSEGYTPSNVKSAYATDPDVVEKVMTAAKQAQEKNFVVQNDEEEIPSLTTLTLTYDTAFGQNTRNYTLLEDDAKAIMTPLMNDNKVTQAAWASLLEADISDIVEMSYSPALADYVGGYAVYLLEDPSNRGQQSGSSLIKNEKDSAKRAEELLKAVQTDLANRKSDVYQTRVIGSINYSVLTKNEYGSNTIDWGHSLTLYEGDAATAALLSQWREEGFLDDETEQMQDMLSNYEGALYRPDDTAEWKNCLGTLTVDDFINAYLAGDIVDSNQVFNHGVEAEEDVILVLSDGPLTADNDTAYIGNFYIRKGAELPVQSIQ